VTVSPISSDYGIFAANNNASTSGADTTKADSDMFMQLMVAQLKYQDPMNPADSSTMLTQNATFTQVQAIQEMQSEMGMLLSSQLAFGSASMIGQQVSWVDSDGATKTGKVDSVDFTTTGPVANIGDTQVPINSIASIGDRDGSSTATGSTPTGSTPGTNA
jgi:flagellar basal-body rod modification protein FlgD